MASRTSTEYASKKEFSASLIEFRHFDLLRVNGESLQGDWSTNRSARGANTIYDLYAKAAGLLAKPDFPRFLAAAGRFVSDSEEKYYALWRMVDGKEYFLFKNLSNIAKFEALWDWAQALGAAITLSDGGSLITNTVSVAWLPTPVITASANRETASTGDTVQFTAVTADTAGQLKYQWQRSADGVSWTVTTLPGNKTSVLAFEATEARLSYWYRCRFTDDNGTLSEPSGDGTESDIDEARRILKEWGLD